MNKRVMLVLGAVLAILLAANGAIFGLVVWPAFVDVEQTAAQKNVNRVADALAGEQQNLERVAHDWSAWDPTYEYVVKPNDEYDRQSFTFDVMRDLNLNLLAIYDINGKLVRTETYDFDTGKELTVDTFAPAIPAADPLMLHAEDQQVSGILLTEHGPMLLAGFPILQSTREGPVRGTLFMGRFVNKAMVDGLVNQTHVQFDVFQTDQTTLPGDLKDISGHLLAGKDDIFKIADSKTLDAFHLLATMRDGAPLMIQVETPRAITGIARTTLGIAGISTLVAGFLLMGMMWHMLTRHIVVPLKKLTAHVLEVGQTGDLTKRLTLDRGDEIGVLAREFDAANSQLDNARRRLLEQSYMSGMAEIAAGVMHNIRNALSPVAVTLWKLSETASEAPPAHLETALTELKSETPSPERRGKLLEYLEGSIRKLFAERKRVAEDLKAIGDQNRHIEQILQDHTALSMGVRQAEPVVLSKVVEESARLLPARGNADIQVTFGTGLSSLPPVLGNPIVLAQLLGNLIMNSAEAIGETGRGTGRITIDGAIDNSGDRPMVRMTVSDDGIGIDKANLTNVFERGFSTKRDKTGGLGLHWSANSVAAMAGRMYAESDGPGKGARIHVLLPTANQALGVAA
ncbi:CHASE4 domain-containing protein [Hypericibacter sp.]|uniref:CHASE4 domain-containing protein n=1 Tax=Hypericibacter sp. TaxID=2705401 RepID=UPI003D6D955A